MSGCWMSATQRSPTALSSVSMVAKQRLASGSSTSGQRCSAGCSSGLCAGWKTRQMPSGTVSHPEGWHASEGQKDCCIHLSLGERDERDHAADILSKEVAQKQAPPGPPHGQKSFQTKFPGMGSG